VALVVGDRENGMVATGGRVEDAIVEIFIQSLKNE
jgi:hypothetical protein